MWTQRATGTNRQNDSSGHMQVLSARISHKTSISFPHASCSCIDTALKLYGKDSRGKSRLVSHCFSEQIGLFIYLAIFNALLQRKFGFLMRCDSARGSSHRRCVSVRAPTLAHTERFSKLSGFQNHSCLGKCKPVTTKNENSRERQTQYDKHTGLVHGHMHELFYHNICYCACHRRTFRGKTVIFSVNMLAQILLFCLRAHKKKKIFYIFWEKQEWYSQAPCWSWPESFQWFPCLQDAKRTHNNKIFLWNHCAYMGPSGASVALQTRSVYTVQNSPSHVSMIF